MAWRPGPKVYFLPYEGKARACLSQFRRGSTELFLGSNPGSETKIVHFSKNLEKTASHIKETAWSVFDELWWFYYHAGTTSVSFQSGSKWARWLFIKGSRLIRARLSKLELGSGSKKLGSFLLLTRINENAATLSGQGPRDRKLLQGADQPRGQGHQAEPGEHPVWAFTIKLVLCGTSLPLANTWWVRLTLISICPLF